MFNYVKVIISLKKYIYFSFYTCHVLCQIKLRRMKNFENKNFLRIFSYVKATYFLLYAYHILCRPKSKLIKNL